MSNQHTTTEITDVANWLVADEPEPEVIIWCVGEWAQVDLLDGGKLIGRIETIRLQSPFYGFEDGQWLYVVALDGSWAEWWYGGAAW